MRNQKDQITTEDQDGYTRHGRCPKCGNHLGPHTSDRFGSFFKLTTDDDGEHLEITCKMCGWVGWRLCRDVDA